MGVYMIQQVAAVHLGWGQAPSLRVGEHVPDVLTPRHGACFNS